jgi:two-component sensor histidine kinase
VGTTGLEAFGDQAEVRRLMALDERVMASGIPDQSEIGISAPEGERILLVSRVPLCDAANQVVGLVGVAHDVTDQKQAEVRRLSDLARQRDALVREVHHRIKNHLHGVLNLVRVEIAAHPELTAHLGDLIGQIGAIAEVYGLQGAGQSTVADLDPLVRLIAAGAAGPVEYQGLAAVPLPLRDGDAVPVALVVNELITNALKHRAGADPARPVHVQLQRVGQGVQLTVSAGPARLPRGFDFQARRGLGTGLDLVATLLPSRGAHLAFVQEGDRVRAELRLEAPVIELEAP